MGKCLHMPASPAAAAVEGPFWPASPPPTAVYCYSPPYPTAGHWKGLGSGDALRASLEEAAAHWARGQHTYRTQLAWLAQLLNRLLYSQYIFLATGLQLSAGTWMSVFSTMWKILVTIFWIKISSFLTVFPVLVSPPCQLVLQGSFTVVLSYLWLSN